MTYTSHYQTDVVERTLPGLHSFLEIEVKRHISSNTKLLDLGCGTGAWLVRLERLGLSDLTGVDVDDGKFLPERSRRLVADLNLNNWSSALDPEMFDVITCIEVVEHIENIGTFIDQIGRLLKPKGVIILSTPNIHSLSARLKYFIQGRMKLLDEKGDPTHVSPIYTVALERMLERRSMYISSVATFPREGSMVDSFFLRLLTRCVSIFIENSLAGDIVIFEIRKRSAL